MNWESIKRVFRFRKIRTKLIVIILLISIIPILVLGITSYILAKDALLENHNDNIKKHLSTKSEITDTFLNNIINFERRVLSNRGLREELQESNKSNVSDEGIGLQTYTRLRNILSDILIDQRFIDSVCVFDQYYRSVCYGPPPSHLFFEQFEEIKNQEMNWYKITRESKGREVFFSQDILRQNPQLLSSVKLLLDPEDFNLEPLGLLVVTIKDEIFGGQVNDTTSGTFVVIDSNNNDLNIVYDSNEMINEQLLGHDILSTIKLLEKSGYVVTSHLNEITNWTFLQIVEEKYLLSEARQIGVMTFFVIISIVIMVLIFSIFVSERMIRPLTQLKRVIGDWLPRASNQEHLKEVDEFSQLGHTFKLITTENKTLNEKLITAQLKQRESELRALQSQIKPHFLYNTLDSIYWMAILEKNHKIAQLVVSLSETFKLTLNKGKDLIPLAQELQHIEHYMNIQNIRFDNRFHYLEKVEESLKDTKILKLTLQPLVENAIYHGLEPKKGIGTVQVIGKKMNDDYILLSIIDDGVGMPSIDVTNNGYGLKNVKERLTLLYGRKCSFEILSKPNKGTEIKIKIPYKDGESIEKINSDR
ncbi:histidine kinase [Bacillus sp. TS-2]|nr:histidine kinase [Bacillus sp. TS-2]